MKNKQTEQQKEFNLKGLSEFEILTLREGLFCFKNSEFYNLTEQEFKCLDNKINNAFKTKGL